MTSLLRDLRHGLRLMGREKAFTSTVLLTLALCVGANVSIFSVVDSVVLNPLPYDGADRIVTLYNSYPGAGFERASTGTVDYFQRRENVPAFEEVALYQSSGSTVGEAGGVDRTRSLYSTASLFPLLRVEAALGRTFGEESMEPGSELEVVLSDAAWRERFGGAPDVLGRTLRVDGRARTVVGVLPPDFRLVGAAEEASLFMPLTLGEGTRDLQQWHSNNYEMLARLRPDATIEQARAQVDALNESLIDRWPVPGARQILEDAGFSTVVVDTREDLVRNVRPVLWLLWAGAGFVLLIGCVNVANLVMARARVRLGEIATRLALGAERRRLAQQLVTEAVLLAGIGAALGLGLGVLGLQGLSLLGADLMPRAAEISVRADVILLALALALVAGLLIGAPPAVHIFRDDLTGVFRTETRTGTAGRSAVVFRNSLVTTQVALAFLLLTGASLMFTSFRAAVSVDPGFEPDGVATAFLALPGARYESGEPRIRFVEELLAEVRALPGVRSAAMTSQLPFTGGGSASVIVPEGYEIRPGESLLSPFQTWATPGYFETLGIGVVEGRTFLPSDRSDQPNVIVIDEWLARRYWPDSSPLGERMLFGAVPGMEVEEDDLYTIVGVVASVKQNDLTAGDQVGAYYFPYAQSGATNFLTLVAAARGEPTALFPALREATLRLDPELPLFDTRTMDARIDASLAGRRTPMLLLGLFAGVALFLAVIGLYGSLAYSVAQRTREMGIRMAIGSSPESIFGLVVSQGMRVTAAGLVLGIAGSFLLTRAIQSLLFGVEAGDLRVMGAAALALAIVAAAACVVPAWRATRLSPTEALTEP